MCKRILDVATGLKTAAIVSKYIDGRICLIPIPNLGRNDASDVLCVKVSLHPFVFTRRCTAIPKASEL